MKAYICLIALAAASMSLSSCSIFKKAGDNETTKISNTEIKPSKNKNGNSNAGSTLSEKPTQEELCGAQWNIVSAGEITINAEDDTPYVHFSDDGRFYASDGCNILNGTYALKSDGKMTFGNVLSTMKYCPDVEYSALIASILSDKNTVTADCKRIGQDTYLYFKNEANKTVLTLRRHNMEFLNGNWQVTAIDGKKIDDEEANIFIDIRELKVHGNTGCNFFNGDLYIDPQRSNAIDFSNMGLTRMACPKADQERRMMVALETAATAIEGKHEGTVLILDKKGKEVLTLKRIPIPSADERQ